MVRRKSFVILLLLFLIPLKRLNGNEQLGNSSKLDNVLSHFDMDNTTVEAAAAHLIVSSDLVGGIIISGDCGDQGMSERKDSFHLSGLTIRRAFDQILSIDQHYRWWEQDQAILISSTREIPELLKTKIEHFEVRAPRSTLSAASGELLQLPEVKDRSKQLGLKQGIELFVGPFDRRQLLQSKVSVDGVNMLDALNAIARGTESAVWRYSEYHCGTTNENNISWIVR